MSRVNWKPGSHPSIPSAVWTPILAANAARKAYTILNEEASAGNVFRIARQAFSPDRRQSIVDVIVPEKTDIDDIDLVETDPVEVTIEDHGFATGDKLTFLGVGGSTELNENEYTITKTGDDTFTLDGTDSSDFSSFTTGGTVHIAADVIIEIPEHGFANGEEVTISGVVGATELNDTFDITKIDGNTFSLDGLDGGTITDYESGGLVIIPDATAGFALNPSGAVECNFDALDLGPVYAYQATEGSLTTLFVQEAN